MISPGRATIPSATASAKCRLKACCAQTGYPLPGRANWGPAPLRWLAAGVCPTPAQQIVCPAEVRPSRCTPSASGVWPRHAASRAPRGVCTPVVDALQALRGVPCTVAVTMGADMGALPRFEPPSALMQCLGWSRPHLPLVQRRQQGARTKTGQTPGPPRTGRRRLGVSLSREGQPPGATATRTPTPQVSRTAVGRPTSGCGKRSRRLVATGKHAHGVPGAMARELRGLSCGPWPRRCPSPCKDPKTVCATPSLSATHAQVCQRASEETQPRCRCNPRRREEARKGDSCLERGRHPTEAQEGGTQPTESRRINRRVFLAPPLLMHKGTKNA